MTHTPSRSLCPQRAISSASIPITPTIKIKKLYKYYGKAIAIRGIDLVVQRGELFGLIGPDGAGKTTVFHILGGVMEATAGEVKILDLPAREARLFKSQMKIVFVNPVGAVGGAERAMLTFMKALIERQESSVELHLIVGTEGPLIEEAQKLGVKVNTLKLPEEFNQLGDSAFKKRNRVISILLLLSRSLKTLPSLINYGKEFKQTLQAIQPDLIHSNGIKTHLLTIFAKPQNVPLIWHIHDFYGSRPLMAKILGWSSVRAQCGMKA